MASILIVDDDPEFANRLSRQVERIGHGVVTAPRLRGGIEKVKIQPIDAALPEVHVPDGNGISAVPRFKEAASHPEAIVLTGVADPDAAEGAIRGGAWDYREKGRPFQSLASPLRHAVGYRQEEVGNGRPRPLDLGQIIGQSPPMKACIHLLAPAADSDTNVLLTGDTGTGKKLFASAIHRSSARREGAFVAVDCAAIPENLVESMLFGYARGAFTGAARDHAGLIGQAEGGTLFLDEVGEISIPLQKTFLRVLQERRFRRVGGRDDVASDFRLIAATNRDLDEMAARGQFREDLLFRLRSLVIGLPPLRVRSGDIREITRKCIERSCERDGEKPKGISPELFKVLETYPWPGNVRELVQALERALAAAGDQPTLFPCHLPTRVRVHAARAAAWPAPTPPRKAGPKPLRTPGRMREAAKAAYLRQLIVETHGRVEEACRVADLSRSRLYELLKKHGIPRLVTSAS